MPPAQITEQDKAQRLAQERRLQVAGALLLGLAVLLLVVLRAGIHNVFPPGWWRHL